MSHALVIQRFLDAHPGEWFDDDTLSERLNIYPRQTVNQVCRSLSSKRVIRREVVAGKTRNSAWVFGSSNDEPKPEGLSLREGATFTTGAQFEVSARLEMSKYFGCSLQPRAVSGVPKKFDLVSADESIVGDAKSFSMVRGTSPPPAKFSVIAEYVWLLEKVPAAQRFLVFGNDRRVPTLWLAKYGALSQSIEFFFLDASFKVEKLSGSNQH